MDKQHLFPVTEENFSQVWAHVDTLRRKARVKAMTAKIGGFISNFLFLLGVLLLVNGLIFTHFSGTYVDFLNSLSFFHDLWEPLSGLVSADAAIYINGIKLLVADYVVSALVFALFAGLIQLIYRPRAAAIKKAQLYTGNQWQMQNITEFVTFDPASKVVTVAEECLQGLEAGEYYIMLDPVNEKKQSVGFFHIPLLVSDTTTFNSTQRGLAACGDDMRWLYHDLEAPAEVTLSFYNLGDNPIRSLLKFNPSSLDIPVSSELYTISENGHTVIPKPEFFAEHQQGMLSQFKFVLANGEILEMGNVKICTVKNGETGHLKITGPETYSLSKDGDLVLTYDMGIAAMISNVQLMRDGSVLIKDESLNDLTSDYVDFDNRTMTQYMTMEDGSKMEMVMKMENKFDDNGKYIGQDMYTNGTLSAYYEIATDDQNRILSQKAYSPDGTMTSTIEATWDGNNGHMESKTPDGTMTHYNDIINDDQGNTLQQTAPS